MKKENKKRWNRQKVKNMLGAIIKKIEPIDVTIFFIMAIILGFWLFVYYPGNMSFDSYNQLSQIYNMSFTTGHPFVHTFIEFICLKVWNSPASIALIQIITYIITWIMICKYNRKKGSKAEKIFQVIITIIMCFNPIIGTYTITLWKDILYSIVILQIGFIVEILVDKKFKVGNLYVIILSFLLILVKNIRYNGAIITLGFSIIIVFLLFVYDRKRFTYLKFIGLLVAFNFLIQIPSLFFNIESSGPKIDAGVFNNKFVQAMGAYVVNGDLKDYELNELSNYVDISKLRQSYNPYFMDPILGISDIDSNEMMDFNKFVIKVTLKYPKTSIRFWTKSTVVLWKITNQNDMIGSSVYTTMYAANQIDGIKHVNENTKLYKDLDRLVYKISENKVSSMFLYNPALYFYLSVLICIYLFIKKKRWMFMIIVPNLLNIFGLILSLPIQDVRYVYANFLVFFMSLVILIDKIGNEKKRISKN